MDHAASYASEPISTYNKHVLRDLRSIDYPAKAWVRSHNNPTEGHILDVLIIGGGQCGLGIGFGLMREKVDNILVIDENPAGQEGPWVTYARMVTLRTPKHLTSIDYGIPSLTFRSWWEAQYGETGWEELGKIPREAWMRYLRWYRDTLSIPVRNQTKARLIESLGRERFRVQVTDTRTGEDSVLLARKIVLATGIQGGGVWHTPPIMGELPKKYYAHTSEMIDYNALAGKKIGILGGGASAFDNAHYALGRGVKEAHVFIRRAELPRINPIRFMENSGFIGHFSDLDDATKYAAIDHFLNFNQPPTNDTFQRAKAYAGFTLHKAEPWQSVREVANGVEVVTPQGGYVFDFLVLSTGLLTDSRLRPELALLADDIACWRDRYTPPKKQNQLIDDHPYLGADFRFLPKTPQAEDKIYGLFNFNYAALASQGLSASALSGFKYAAPKLVYGLVSQLFTDDAKAILADYYAYAEEEFTG